MTRRSRKARRERRREEMDISPRSLETPEAQVAPESEPGGKVDFIAMAIEQSLIEGRRKRGRDDGGQGARA
jgi:hypothetical protein